MKRDMDLVRKILLRLEGVPFEERSSEIDMQGYDQQTVSFHIMLLDEAGLVKGIDASGVAEIYWFADRLTWEGYEFLEASKDDENWKRATSLVASKGGGMVFEVLKQVLVAMARDAALAALG
ncbi:MAG: DUF2513 domain-containing protein [Chloroflexi bacterium]|nr:DUF2513 domain-containing protein [Chloroflexota bacterium]